MKYFSACLIILMVPILLLVIFGLGAVYFGMADLLERMRYSSTDEAVNE